MHTFALEHCAPFFTFWFSCVWMMRWCSWMYCSIYSCLGRLMQACCLPPIGTHELVMGFPLFLPDVRIFYLDPRLSWVISWQVSRVTCQWGKESEEREPGSWTVGQRHRAWLLSVSGPRVAWLPSCVRCSPRLGRDTTPSEFSVLSALCSGDLPRAADPVTLRLLWPFCGISTWRGEMEPRGRGALCWWPSHDGPAWAWHPSPCWHSETIGWSHPVLLPALPLSRLPRQLNFKSE